MTKDSIRPRSSPHHHDPPGLGVQPEGQLEVGCQARLYIGSGHVGFQGEVLQKLLEFAGKNHRHAGKDDVPVFQHEFYGRVKHGDDDIQSPVGVFAAEQMQELIQIGRLFKAAHIQILDIEVHGLSAAGLQGSPQALINLRLRRENGAEGVKHQDVLGFL